MVHGYEIPKSDLEVLLLFVYSSKETKGLLSLMTQDEKWLAKYNEIIAFMAKNHRNPSKHFDEEKR